MGKRGEHRDARAAAPPPAERGADPGPTSHVAPSAARKRVLVADDDDDARRAIEQVLIAEGYDVIVASDGAGALEYLANAADRRAPLPDVMLLDVLMPGLSGLGILRAVRRFERVPPTIIMTGFNDRSVEVFARNLGAARVLRKPIDFEALREAIAGALEGKPERAGR